MNKFEEAIPYWFSASALGSAISGGPVGYTVLLLGMALLSMAGGMYWLVSAPTSLFKQMGSVSARVAIVLAAFAAVYALGYLFIDLVGWVPLNLDPTNLVLMPLHRLVVGLIFLGLPLGALIESFCGRKRPEEEQAKT